MIQSEWVINEPTIGLPHDLGSLSGECVGVCIFRSGLRSRVVLSLYNALRNAYFGGSFGQFRSGRWRAAEVRYLPFLYLLLLNYCFGEVGMERCSYAPAVCPFPPSLNYWKIIGIIVSVIYLLTSFGESLQYSSPTTLRVW